MATEQQNMPRHYKPGTTQAPSGWSAYSRSHRLIEIAAISIFVSLFLVVCARLALHIDGGSSWVWIVVAASIGMLVSDFLSGAAHWAGDTLGDERMPILGRHFIAPFRAHHTDPGEITRHDFIEINGNTCIVLLPAVLALAWINPGPKDGALFGALTVVFTCFFVFCTNQFHKWAHQSNPPALVQSLQSSGLILSPARHAIHHAHPTDHYCITVGWMNPVLARLRFFRRVESLVAWVRPQLLQHENTLRTWKLSSGTGARGRSPKSRTVYSMPKQ
jgi:hypothetical protein